MAKEKSETYDSEISCNNCGYFGTETLERGMTIAESECPVCGCCSLERHIIKEVSKKSPY